MENCLSTYDPHACIIVYSITEKGSFKKAEDIITYLWRENYTTDKAVILVGNKVDLARSRLVSNTGESRGREWEAREMRAGGSGMRVGKKGKRTRSGKRDAWWRQGRKTG